MRYNIIKKEDQKDIKDVIKQLQLIEKDDKESKLCPYCHTKLKLTANKMYCPNESCNDMNILINIWLYIHKIGIKLEVDKL